MRILSRKRFHRAARMHRCRTLNFESFEARTMLSAVAVTSSADSGPGTFREAVEQANADPSVAAIVFAPRVNTVPLESTIEYTGSQALRIDGNVVNIEPVAAEQGEIDLFVASGGGDLLLSQITFREGANGVVVDVPEDASGVIHVALERAAIEDNSLFGLHIVDLTEVPPPPDDPEAEPTETGSDAGVSLRLLRSEITGNGTEAHDQDGIRVDERAAGDVDVQILNSRLNANGAEGIELDEGGAGDVNLNAFKSQFNGNGFISSGDPENPDFDDGIDIDEAGDGDITAVLVHVKASGNFDEGIDLNEDGDGDLHAALLNVRANNNIDEGVALAELGAGGLSAVLIHVKANRNGADGVRFEEFDEGDLAVDIAFSTMNHNGGYGVFASQAPPGDGLVRLHKVKLKHNDEGPFNTTAEDEETGEEIDSGVDFAVV